ncbi:ABC transporter [Tetragenococcus osmophilus]|uniref:ABC transporter n=1 Tax=Tetragenococcus osmophilus TaxID=526944 RepID=A0AA37XLF0_9ENTE|nr:ABC transporter ATP-binding protein [Tetragenococcus osmophilus]AYW48043.1 ABC transporter [Tetragenococcus osmophilus]GMA72301.1 ABC transporter [Tetragenococcus osmophilus]
MRNNTTLVPLLRILSYIWRDYKLNLMFVILFVLLSTGANTIGSLFIQSVVDDYITPLLTQMNPNYTGLLKIILVMGFIYLIGVISALLFNRIMVTVSQGTQMNIRNDMFAKMQTLPVRFFDENASGDIMSHYTNDIDTLRQMISQSIPQVFQAATQMLGVLIAMLTLNIPLTFVVLFTVILIFLVVKKIAGLSSRYFVYQQRSLGEVDGYIEEMTFGQKVVKVFTHEEESKEGFVQRNEQLFRDTSKANQLANILLPIMINLGNLQYVLIALVGGILSIEGYITLSIGTLIAFLQLSRSFSGPLNQISQQVNFIVMALAGAARIFELIDTQPEEDTGEVTLVNVYQQDNQLKESSSRTGNWAWKQPLSDGRNLYTKVKGKIDFEDVSFGYKGDQIILQDISLHAQPGQKIALVGATGAGKTTITNLLNRFYDINQGEIFYDGIDIKKIKKADLRRSLGMVLQDTNLFSGSIRENIRYGNLEATDKEVIEAAKLANADHFIEDLMDGYDTVISGQESNLSQGQQQLLSIARAALANNPVLVLDEATSSIDTLTEKLVQNGMDSLMQGRTVFVIAHRLSTIQNSDVIIVLDHGRIIERGTHQQLIENKKIYYQLYTGKLELS